jgi:hypothetical protein
MNDCCSNRAVSTRRAFLAQSLAGTTGLALAHLLASDRLLGDDGRPRAEIGGGIHHPAKVRRVIELFMNGGVSQMDTFDHKPALDKRHGQTADLGIKSAATSVPGPLMKSPFGFKQHGECGRWVSEVFPQIATCVDKLAFLMAMSSRTNVHGPASYLQNTGFLVPGFPCFGAWVSYALGRLSDDLPTFIVLPDPRGLPYNATGSFSPGFLPATHQGLVVPTASPVPIPDLAPHSSAAFINAEASREGLELLHHMNTRFAADRPGDSRLAARIEAYELAARMQIAAPEAFDLNRETKETHARYGTDAPDHEGGFARNCLTARRLIERGVRFVQVWSGPGGPTNNWDNHTDIPKELPPIARQVDRPIAALLRDLEARGLLEDTLVIWTTEFGRMPCTQGSTGRDHNGGTFVSWLAGAGVRGGTAYGESDEIAYQAGEGKTTGYDLHATALHLLGIDHERLTVRHNGSDRRLTDVHGRVIHPILA